MKSRFDIIKRLFLGMYVLCIILSWIILRWFTQVKREKEDPLVIRYLWQT